MLNIFKKNKKSLAKRDKNYDPVDVFKIMEIVFGKEEGKEIIKEFKVVIREYIEEIKDVKIMELLDFGLDFIEEMIPKEKNQGENCGKHHLKPIILYRWFFDSVLLLDIDNFMTISDMYCISTQCGIDNKLHLYIKTILEIWRNIDLEIIYMAKNYDHWVEGTYFDFSKKIKVLLNSYKDDNTGWNKILSVDWSLYQNE